VEVIELGLTKKKALVAKRRARSGNDVKHTFYHTHIDTKLRGDPICTRLAETRNSGVPATSVSDESPASRRICSRSSHGRLSAGSDTFAVVMSSNTAPARISMHFGSMRCFSYPLKRPPGTAILEVIAIKSNRQECRAYLQRVHYAELVPYDVGRTAVVVGHESMNFLKHY
jgi:hypothetical protein